MKEWRRAYSKCWKQVSIARRIILLQLLLLLIKKGSISAKIPLLTGDTWMLIEYCLFSLIFHSKATNPAAWQLRVSMYFRIFSFTSNKGCWSSSPAQWPHAAPTKSCGCSQWCTALRLLLTTSHKLPPPTPSCKVKFNRQNWSAVSGA